jgi:hypothetical protein
MRIEVLQGHAIEKIISTIYYIRDPSLKILISTQPRTFNGDLICCFRCGLSHLSDALIARVRCIQAVSHTKLPMIISFTWRQSESLINARDFFFPVLRRYY